MSSAKTKPTKKDLAIATHIEGIHTKITDAINSRAFNSQNNDLWHAYADEIQVESAVFNPSQRSECSEWMEKAEFLRTAWSTLPLVARVSYQQANQIEGLEHRLQRREQTWLLWLYRLIIQFRDRARGWLHWLLARIRERLAMLRGLRRQVRFYQNLLENHPETLVRMLSADEGLVERNLSPTARSVLLQMALHRVQQGRVEESSEREA
ncbi:hypothetical protein PRZ48_010667 [Zasmidium cellare]|uniref:Uncharacterized protein n=1 Tax=Zasmidium cellare TaxID=395010 RepID=A0ABR0E9W7_ZASCE|nr:hypothetical protein PRZ48_010667 [Zasmidium cellare]